MYDNLLYCQIQLFKSTNITVAIAIWGPIAKFNTYMQRGRVVTTLSRLDYHGSSKTLMSHIIS